jgi:hypothetical protein
LFGFWVFLLGFLGFCFDFLDILSGIRQKKTNIFLV